MGHSLGIRHGFPKSCLQITASDSGKMGWGRSSFQDFESIPQAGNKLSLPLRLYLDIFLFVFFCFVLFPSPEDMLIDFRERGRDGKRERNIDWLLLAHALTGDKTCNPGTCPDLNSNLQPFGLQNDASTTCTTLTRATSCKLVLFYSLDIILCLLS